MMYYVYEHYTRELLWQGNLLDLCSWLKNNRKYRIVGTDESHSLYHCIFVTAKKG